MGCFGKIFAKINWVNCVSGCTSIQWSYTWAVIKLGDDGTRHEVPKVLKRSEIRFTSLCFVGWKGVIFIFITFIVLLCALKRLKLRKRQNPTSEAYILVCWVYLFFRILWRVVVTTMIIFITIDRQNIKYRHNVLKYHICEKIGVDI